MKKLSWNLRYGNKGLIFSLDITIAVFIVILILIVSIQYINRGDSSINKIQMLRTGNDVMHVLDYEKVLDTLNSNTIKNEKDLILPPNYNMRIKVDCNNVDTSEKIPKNRFIGGSKRTFVVVGEDNVDFCTGWYWIWPE